jgi:hypothetical protein
MGGEGCERPPKEETKNLKGEIKVKSTKCGELREKST